MTLAIHPSPAISMHSTPPAVVPQVKVFDANEGPHMSSITFPDLPLPIAASLSGAFDCTKEGVDTTIALYASLH